MSLRATIVPVVLLASGCYVTTSGGRPYDGGADDTGRPRRDAGPTDSGGARDTGPAPDAGPPPPDAGPPVPTAISDVVLSTTADGHPAVVWDGREFVLAFLVGDRSGTRVADVHLAWYPPGSVTPSGTMSLTGSALERDSVSISASGGRLAVGWTERPPAVSAPWTFIGRTVGDSGMVPTYGNCLDRPDLDDAFVFWDGRWPIAVARTPEGAVGEALYGLEAAGPTRFHGEMVIGEISPVSNQTMIVTGTGARVFERGAVGWIEVARASGLLAPTEGDGAILADGSLGMIFVDRPLSDPALHYLRFARAGSAWMQTAPPVPIGESGPDPAVDAVGDRLIVAWARATMVDRPAAVAAVGPDGRLVGPWCRLPERWAVANEPDIACSAAWCMVAWVEASTFEATDFVTRIIQLPVEPDLVCP